MQRKCKTCGAHTPLGYSDPDSKEAWLASACDVHVAQIERAWLQWCHDNGRRVLPPEYRHPDNRDLDTGQAKGAGDATEQPKRGSGRGIRRTAHDPEQGTLI